MDDLELFLAHADDARPVLAEGLPPSSLTNAPRPPPEPLPRHLRYDTGDAHSLPQQRWALLAPEGPEGDRLLGAVDPLSRARREAQDADVRVYRVPSGLGPSEATRWKEQVYEDESVLPEDRPRYLVILGDADRISWDLQHRLATDTFVGRIAFPDERGYEAYADKVLRWERAPAAPGVRALFYTACDGTIATTLGHRMLMQPTVALAKERRARGTLPVTEIVALEGDSTGSPDALLQQTVRPEPTLLFSMSHGLGAPLQGWDSADDQRAMQGAMSLGPGRRLAAADLGSRPFLPGGVWFFFACFSAGTPSTSAYHRWLLLLQQTGKYRGRVDAVLAGLPREGDRSFVAALPQAVLENPDGPLAVIGHVDLAWTSTFLDAGTPSKGRPGRFQDLVRVLADGGRAGAACFELLRFWSSADAHLSMLYGDDDRPEDDAKTVLKARLWMLRNGLRGYVLLGDPAARLAIALGAPVARASQISGLQLEARPASVRDPEQMEQAVLEALSRKELPSVIAKRAGIGKGELQEWVDAYQAAGRAALAKIGR